MRLAFLPREEKFFFLLHQSAMNIQKVAIKLQDLMEDYTNVKAKVEEIKTLEEFGDEAIHQIMQALHRTFVTPLDREDIALLAERLDDVVDAIEEAARTMLFCIKPCDIDDGDIVLFQRRDNAQTGQMVAA